MSGLTGLDLIDTSNQSKFEERISMVKCRDNRLGSTTCQTGLRGDLHPPAAGSTARQWPQVCQPRPHARLVHCLQHLQAVRNHWAQAQRSRLRRWRDALLQPRSH